MAMLSLDLSVWDAVGQRTYEQQPDASWTQLRELCPVAHAQLWPQELLRGQPRGALLLLTAKAAQWPLPCISCDVPNAIDFTRSLQTCLYFLICSVGPILVRVSSCLSLDVRDAARLGDTAGGETHWTSRHLNGLVCGASCQDVCQLDCSCPLMKFALQNPDSIIDKASHAHRQAGPSRPHGHVALQAGLERMLK